MEGESKWGRRWGERQKEEEKGETRMHGVRRKGREQKEDRGKASLRSTVRV